MSTDRSDLHALLDRIPETNLPATRKLLQALAVVWDVAPAEAEGEFKERALRDVQAAEAFFDKGGKGIPQEEILKEFDLA
ncbi:MAG: hypothetical protein HY820_14490 [Acidobacteria bacterium]|nr:hypothetical protein [Acidobacteriota bacterium]